MDITTVLAVISSAIVFLSWFVLPHGASSPAADFSDNVDMRSNPPEAIAAS